MVQISGISSYPVFKLSVPNCTENSILMPRGREIWVELVGVRVICGSSYLSYIVLPHINWVQIFG